MTGHLYEKNGKYHMMINAYDENGKLRRRSIATGLKVKNNKTKAEAMLRNTIRAMELQAEELRRLSPDKRKLQSITLAEAVDRWMVGAKRRIDAITYQGYDSLVRLHIRPYFKANGILLREATVEQMQTFFDQMAESGRANGKGGLSPRTLRLLKNIVYQTFKEAVRDGVIVANPCEYVILPSLTRYDFHYYTREEMKALLAAIVDDPLYPVIKVTYTYGLRRSEALGLKWDCVNFEDKTLIIKRTVVRVSEIVEKDRTKNETSRRSFPISPEMETLLRGLKAQQEADRKLCGKSYVNSEHVFCWPDGRPFSPDYVSKHFAKLLEKHGFSHIRFHELRHSSASNLLSMGFTLKDVQEWLGHSDIKMTANIYGHLDVQRKKMLANAMEFSETSAQNGASERTTA